MAEHRIGFGELRGALAHLGGLDPGRLRHLGDLGVAVRQELMQGRIEQADRHRQPLHDAEQLDEVAALHRQDLGQRLAPTLGVLGQDHLAHGDDALALEEHVLRAA